MTLVLVSAFILGSAAVVGSLVGFLLEMFMGKLHRRRQSREFVRRMDIMMYRLREPGYRGQGCDICGGPHSTGYHPQGEKR